MTGESPPPEADRRPAVLVVDDETPLLEAMQEGLEAEFDVTTATCAAEAEALLDSRKFAVLVCDHMMPGETGLDFLVRMRELHPATRRILVTGYINPELLSRSVKVAELAACLLKPVNTVDLLGAVRAAVSV